MPCTHVRMPGGGSAIICTRGRRSAPKVCACRHIATRECDWKAPGKKSGTCDAPLCSECTHEPAPGKDLCPKHAAEWQARLAGRCQPEAPRETSKSADVSTAQADLFTGGPP